VNLSLHLPLDKAIMKSAIIKQKLVQRRENEFSDGVPQGTRSQDLCKRKIRKQPQQKHRKRHEEKLNSLMFCLDPKRNILDVLPRTSFFSQNHIGFTFPQQLKLSRITEERKQETGGANQPNNK